MEKIYLFYCYTATPHYDNHKPKMNHYKNTPMPNQPQQLRSSPKQKMMYGEKKTIEEEGEIKHK